MRLITVMLAPLGVGGSAGAFDLETARLVDLTHTFDAETVYWPGSAPFRHRSTARGMTPGGWWYAAGEFAGAEHGGTHVDAPVHFAAERWTVDALPLGRLVGVAVVVDMTAQAAEDADALLGRATLDVFETHHGRIPDGAIVLVRTGWDRHWSEPARYLGSAAGDASDLHFPGLDPEAAEWLSTARRVRAVGIDTASIDRGASRSFRAHRVLANANVPIFENLTGLATLPPTGAIFLGLPMKIGGGTGAPLRAVAVLP